MPAGAPHRAQGGSILASDEDYACNARLRSAQSYQAGASSAKPAGARAASSKLTIS